jgi:short-subunit dehydrogenase
MANNREIAGKTALISGAGSGIGLALAKEFGQKGATVIGTDINKDRVDSMLSELKKLGIKAFGYQVDHGNLADVEAFVQKVKQDVGPVDILCCNAGVGILAKTDTMTLAEWKWTIDVNLYGVIYLLHFFMPSMIERKQGQVLITASGAGLNPLGAMAAYSMTKAALVSLTNVLRMEFQDRNINVSALCPGIIKTNIAKDATVRGDENKAAAIEFYATQGVSPAIVAKTAIKGLMKNKGIIPAPWGQVALPALVYRISPTFMVWVGRMLFRQGRNLLGPFFN